MNLFEARGTTAPPSRSGQSLAEKNWTKLEAVGLGWVDFRVMRRTHETLMNEIHDETKLAADQLGHTVDVNQDVYTRGR